MAEWSYDDDRYISPWGDATTMDESGGESPPPNRRPKPDTDRPIVGPALFNPDGTANLDNVEAQFLPGKSLDTEQLKNIYSALGGRSMLQRAGLYGERLQRQRELAAGSPQALLQQFGAQVSRMREQLGNAFEAVSRRMGPQGGGQIKEAGAQALAGAARGMQGQLAVGQQQGIANLHAALSLVPAQAASIPTKFEQTQPFNAAQLGEALAGVVSTAYDAFGGGQGGGYQNYSTFSPNPALVQQANYADGWSRGAGMHYNVPNDY